MQNVNRRPNHEHIFMKQNVLCNFSSALVPLPLPLPLPPKKKCPPVHLWLIGLQ